VDYFGLAAFAVVALLLIGLTLWSYLGIRGTTSRRVLALLALRLGALFLVFFVVLRVAFGFSDQTPTSSILLIAVDDSESMTIQDEFDGQSRWERMRRALRKCEPELRKLREEHGVTVVLYRFSEGVRPFDPADDTMQADGKRSDYSLMLRTLFNRHGSEPYLRGLVVMGDGASNGNPPDPLAVAGDWRDKRSRPCPIHTFAFGKDSTTGGQSDIALTDITVTPAPVPAKGKLKITALANAPGFENHGVMVHVFIDDKEVPILVANKDVFGGIQEDLHLTTGNELHLECNAPAQPGEVKVTVKITPLPTELITSNNEISTFATVTKEGVSVLYVDKRREELGYIARALATDPRIRVTYALLGGATGNAPAERNLFHFDDRPYDVVIVGDVTYDEVSRADRSAPAKIKELVGKGAGVMMIGGERNFGKGGWQGRKVGDHWEQSELRDVLPVDMSDTGEIKAKTIGLARTDIGKKHFLLRLADNDQENEEAWRDLKLYGGISLMGKPKENIAEPLLKSAADDNVNILVAAEVNGGRSLAFAGDTTRQWVRPPKGNTYFERFWRQMVLWLAHQEKTESKLWIKPDERRVKTGHRLGFSVGIRGKDGLDLKGASFTPKITGPSDRVWKTRENGEDRIIVEPTKPGEYQLIVNGQAKDATGESVSGQDKVRFLVSQDDTEMARRAADPEFLKRLAAAGGGKFHQGTDDELAAFLRDLPSQPLGNRQQQTNRFPDWRRNDLSAFLPSLLALFAGLVSLEWFFRRRWGMV
jgi:uncharacterized membrane protein